MRNKFKIVLKINNYCNYSCIYCNADIPYLPQYQKHDMSYKPLNLLVQYINKYLSSYDILFVIQGGEPTLHNELNHIIDQLLNIKALKYIMILTNGSTDFSKILKEYWPVKMGISIHCEQLLKHNFGQSLTRIWDNIKYLYSINKKHEIYLMIDNKNEDFDIRNYIIEQYYILTKKLNIIPQYYLMPIVPTENYQITDFDYTTLDNVCNKHKEFKNIFPYRAINIDINFGYDYNCELIHLDNYSCNNILLKKSWKYIVSNLDTTISCNSQHCSCPVCLSVS